LIDLTAERRNNEAAAAKNKASRTFRIPAIQYDLPTALADEVSGIGKGLHSFGC
jgi:hypothetical protein